MKDFNWAAFTSARAFARLSCMIVFALVVGASVQVCAAPQWAEFRGDARRTGRANVHLVYNPTVQVVYRTGSGCSASPVIGQSGVVYYGAYDRCFYGIAPDGTLAWPRYATSDLIITSAAIAADGSVYFGTAGGAVHALYPDGASKWQAPFRAGNQAISGAITVGANGSVCFASDNGRVYSLDPTTGQARWSYYVGGALKYGVTSSPDGSVLYVPSTDGYLYALNNDGTLKWKSKKPVYATNACAVGDNGVIYVGGTDYNLYALNPADGSQVWARRVYGKITTSAAIGWDGSIYFGSADLNFYALDPDGNIRWTYWVRDTVYSSPIIDLEGKVIFGTPSGNVFALNASNGAALWTRTIGAGIYSSPAAVLDGSIYILDSAGVLSRLSGPVSPEPSSLVVLGGGIFFAVAFVVRKSRC